MRLASVATWSIALIVVSAFRLCLANYQGNLSRICTKDDYKYVYTKCDDRQERWRVAIPKKPGQCSDGDVPSPVKGRACDFSCGAGNFMDITTQKCRPCPPGKYSLGRGVRYENWHGKLPAGFVIREIDGNTVLSSMSDELQQSMNEVKSGAKQLMKLLADVGEMKGHGRTRRVVNDGDSGPDPDEESNRFLAQQMNDQARANLNCTGRGWKAVGDFLVAQSSECSSSLDLVVELDTPGYVEYEYTYPAYASAVVFVLQVQTIACQGHASSSHSYHSPQATDMDKYVTGKVVLPRGHTNLSFMAVGDTDFAGAAPLKIRRITVQGVAFTDICTPCPAGYFTASTGTKWCKKCANNTVSEKPGSSSCRACDPIREYANADGTRCVKRQPCKKNDYSVVYSPCNDQGQSSKKYSWKEPKRCSEQLPGAVQLPHSRHSLACPRCNPGMAPTSNSTGARCLFCEGETVGDGNGPCKRCHSASLAVRGIHFAWWQESILTTDLMLDCSSKIDKYARMCDSGESPWILAGEFIGLQSDFPPQTAARLTISTEGFSRSGIGQAEFEYEINCPNNDCVFTVSESRTFGGRILWTWPGGKHGKDRVRISVKSNFWYQCVWSFQWKSSRKPLSQDGDEEYVLKIYSIHLNNTLDGGGLYCEECWNLGLTSSEDESESNSASYDSNDKGMTEGKCVQCPDGQYLARENHECTPCPAGTYLNASQAVGIEACVSCGEGATSLPGATHCHTDCLFHDNSTGRVYNFTALSGVHSLMSRPHFTMHAVKYFHNFKVSLCGAQFDAKCYGNATHSDRGSHRTREFVGVKESKVCRQTDVPLKEGKYHTMPVKLGEQLLTIQTLNDSFKSVSRLPFLPPSLHPSMNQSENQRNLVTLYFQADDEGQNCPLGHIAVITLHCHPDRPGAGELHLANTTQCPDGTCDGCSYGFIWHTRTVCPPCTDSDYERWRSACNKDGMKDVRNVKNNTSCFGGVEKPLKEREKCSLSETTVAAAVHMYLPFVLTAVAVAGLIILSLVVVVWKNRRLEYKYQRLVQSASAAAELPAPEKCVEDDDDEDGDGEEAEEVIFSRQRSQASKFMRKLKGFTTTKQGEKLEDFDSIPLTESQA